MIKELKANFVYKRENAKELNEQGFISSVRLGRLDHDGATKLGLDYAKLDNPKDIINKFRDVSGNYCICLQYSTTNKKYWYKLSDLQKLYGYNSKLELKIEKNSFKNRRKCKLVRSYGNTNYYVKI